MKGVSVSHCRMTGLLVRITGKSRRFGIDSWILGHSGGRVGAGIIVKGGGHAFLEDCIIKKSRQLDGICVSGHGSSVTVQSCRVRAFRRPIPPGATPTDCTHAFRRSMGILRWASWRTMEPLRTLSTARYGTAQERMGCMPRALALAYILVDARCLTAASVVWLLPTGRLQRYAVVLHSLERSSRESARVWMRPKPMGCSWPTPPFGMRKRDTALRRKAKDP